MNQTDILQAALTAGDSRQGMTDELMRLGWSEEDADDAVWQWAEDYELAEGEPLWPTKEQQIAKTQKEQAERLAEYRAMVAA